MYLEGCSRVALYNGSKIMIIRLTNQKIWKETYKKTTKKTFLVQHCNNPAPARSTSDGTWRLTKKAALFFFVFYDL